MSSTINVANATELTAALIAARGGETIVLAAGDYGTLNLRNRTFSSAVTITSADPAQPAHLDSILLTNVVNLTLRHLDVGAALAPGATSSTAMMTVTGSKGIEAYSTSFHGSLDGTPSNDGNGVSFLRSSGIKIVDSNFEQLGRALLIGNSTDIVVTGNRFHDLRSDGADFAEVNNVLIANNSFRDFYPATGDHPDAIQFWTSNTAAPSTDIVIRDNVILQGNGQGLQGIFLTDQVGTLPYERVQITNNLIYITQGSGNGLTLIHARDVTIANNTVLSPKSVRGEVWIRADKITSGLIENNFVDSIIEGGNSQVRIQSNIRLDREPARAADIRDLEALSGATVSGLTTPGVGYSPPSNPTAPQATRIGGEGNDGWVVGATLSEYDFIDGAGGRDVVALQGNYLGYTLGTRVLQNIETFTMLTGADTRFGESGANRFSYDLTTRDENVAAGTQLMVIATTLLEGENFAFNGAAETDGTFFIYGGKGVDTITGGAKNDTLFFAEQRFSAADRVNGGAGTDLLVLRGEYTGANAVTLGANSLTSVETFTVMSASDVRFMPGGSSYSYDVTSHDGNVAAGATLSMIGSKLRPNETFHFNGSAETDGQFRLFGGTGNDVITGGAGNDFFFGNLGRDVLTGGAGSDTFQYRTAAESTGVNCDQLIGFDCRTDKLDLPGDLPGLSDVIAGGLLSSGSFDVDLAAALDAFLGRGEAALFTAGGGDMAGRSFLVVDGNDRAGYQAGEDFVIELVSPLVPINPALDFFV